MDSRGVMRKCRMAALLTLVLALNVAAGTLPELFTTYPVVYTVGDEYQILVPVNAESLMWCRVGDRAYFDESNGILRSNTNTHRMAVPMAELDAAKEYTICYRKVNERLPYFSKTGEVEEATFAFQSVEGDTVQAFMIADAHNRVASPVAAAAYYGDELDLLILNGDIPEDGGDIRNFTTIHAIAGAIGKGRIPVVFSRGNHDMRGIHAEQLVEHTPTRDGNSYFTFRAGPLWGIVLDCGEDKADSSTEYGNTIACHTFRERETAFLNDVIKRADSEYAAPGVKYRVVISHVPFSEVSEAPFNIEKEIYAEWCRLLKENVHPQLMLSGHMHDLYITRPGEARDHLGQPCPVAVGSLPGKTPEEFTGTAVTFAPEGMQVRFVDQDRRVVAEEALPLNR